MKWPVFSEKELVIGNLDSSIGVCTLWSPRKEFAKKNLDKDNSLLLKMFLSESDVKRFLAQTKIIFTETKNIKDFIVNGAYRDIDYEKKEFEPLLIPLPKPEAKNFPTAGSSHLIRVRTIAEGYEAILKEIRFL